MPAEDTRKEFHFIFSCFRPYLEDSLFTRKLNSLENSLLNVSLTKSHL